VRQAVQSIVAKPGKLSARLSNSSPKVLVTTKAMKSEYIIRIGAPAQYEHRYGRNGFAVFRKTLGTVVSYVIAKLPDKVSVSDPPPIPTSVLRDFTSQSDAILALDRYAEAPKDVRLLRKAKLATNLRRNGTRPRRKGVGPGQMDFQF
jgi:hypothetical protein